NGTFFSVMHTNAISGDAIVMKSSKMDLNGFENGGTDEPKDLALLRLDARVPFAFAKPLHVPLLGTPTCPQDDDFPGHVVGYGATDFDAQSNQTGIGTRRSSDYADFFRHPEGYYDGFYTGFIKYTQPADPLALLATFAGYHGIMAADSGGPLVFNSSSGPLL